MTTDKPNVQRYTDMGSETICPINNLRKSDDGSYVLYEDYESLQAEYEKLRKHLQNLIDQTTPLEPEPGNPMWSRRIQLDEVIAERDQLRAKCEKLHKDTDKYRPLLETVQGEPVYLYRRRGLDDFVTCDFTRYTELSGKTNLFETKILYTATLTTEQQPAPDVAELQAELERERKRRFDGNEQASREHREDMKSLVRALECALETMENVDGANDCSRGIDAAEEALAAHRKGGDQL